MFVDILLIAIGLGGIIIGSITDIQKREVADYVNYFLIFSGLGVRLIYSIFVWQWSFFLYGLLGFGSFLALAYIMFLSGQWGGGDSKMLMGMGALFATYPEFLKNYFSPELLGMPFLASFWINLLLLGAVYGVFWTIGLGIFHFKDLKKSMKFYFKIPIIRKVRFYTHLVSIVLILTGIIVPVFIIRLFSLVFGFILLFFVYLFIVIKSVEKACMYRVLTPDKLVEGDWPVDDVLVDGKVVFSKDKKVGFEQEDLEAIMKFYNQKKIKTVKVKHGIPFVPSFLFSLIVTLSYGNIIFLLI